MKIEAQVKEAISLEDVDFNKVRALDKSEYEAYLINKQVEESINYRPEVAIQIVREILHSPNARVTAILLDSKLCPAFSKWVKKFKGFVLSTKYDKIEALSDYALGKFNPKSKDKRYSKQYKYYKI